MASNGNGGGGGDGGDDKGALKGGKGGQAKKAASWCRNCKSTKSPCPCELKQFDVPKEPESKPPAPAVGEAAKDWLQSNLSGEDAAALSTAFSQNGIDSVEDMKLVTKDDLAELQLSIGTTSSPSYSSSSLLIRLLCRVGLRNRFLAARAAYGGGGGGRPRVEATDIVLSPPQQAILGAMMTLTPAQIEQLPPQVQVQLYRIRNGPAAAAAPRPLVTGR